MTSKTQKDPKVRLDKWLWAARFYKTRSLAKAAIEGGKVRYNNQRCKPGKVVETGAQVTVRISWEERVVIIDGISGQRRGAPEAAQLYHETDESISGREDQAWQRKTMMASHLPPARRPSKKDRRSIQRFKERNNI